MEGESSRSRKKHSSDPLVRVVEQIKEGDRFLRGVNEKANTAFFDSGSASSLLASFDQQMKGLPELRKRLERLQSTRVPEDK